MLRTRSVFLLAAVSLVGIFALPSSTYAQAPPPAFTARGTLHTDFTAPGFCTGESIHWTGDETVTAVFVQNDNVFHVTIHVNENLASTGVTTGADYELIGQSTVGFQVALSPGGETFPTQLHSTNTFGVTGDRAHPNERVTESFVFVVNADGTIEVSRGSFDDSCRD
jgi:hypothetical protein